VSGEDRNGTLGSRLGRLWNAADLKKVPLRTIIVAILAIAFFYLAGKLIYRLRDVLLLMLVAGFLALILNPLVHVVEKYLVKKRGYAVTVVTLLALAAFAGLAYEFGSPLVTGITNFANKLPSYITAAETGKGWIGKGWIGDLVRRYHVQQWVAKNAPKLVTFGQGLAKPALSFGEGALSLLFELFTIFVLVLLLLLEGPKLRRGVLNLFSAGQAREVQAVAGQVNRAVVGYMLGNFTTSVICGITVFISLFATGVPFPGLWAIWVALVDFLPLIGGALAGIPVVLFATASKGVTAGIVVLVVFLVYTQIENHVLNPVIMSKTVRISPLLVLLSVLVGASIGSWVGGIFGGFVAALLSIPAAGALQVIVVEVWRLTGPPTVAETDLIRPDGTVVAVETSGTIEGVDVTLDELEPQTGPDPDSDPDQDSAAPADGAHQRP
jgi:predicted PurR-regulated permease PerM